MRKLLKTLFGTRRWMLWLPVLATMPLTNGNWTNYVPLLVGGLFLWIPYWFAWWLSDGFSNMRVVASPRGGRRYGQATAASDIYYNTRNGQLKSLS